MKDVIGSANWEGSYEEVAMKKGPGDRNQEYRSMEFSSWTLTKITVEGNDKGARIRVNSVVDEHTN